jgi:hypothetical protein
MAQEAAVASAVSSCKKNEGIHGPELGERAEWARHLAGSFQKRKMVKEIESSWVTKVIWAAGRNRNCFSNF